MRLCESPSVSGSVSRLAALVLSLAIFLLPHAAFALEPPQEDTVFVGPIIGGGASQISQPADPAGSLTYLYGTAFTGGCFVIGVTSAVDFARFFSLEADVTYAFSSLSGFAETGEQRLDVTIRAHDVRLAVIPLLDIELEKVAIEVGAGPEVAFVVGGTIDEVPLGFVSTDPQLQTTTSVWFYLVSQASVVFRLDGMEVPIGVRVGWNPGYPDTTAERFDGFRGADDPGEFRVGANWYLTALVGVRFGF